MPRQKRCTYQVTVTWEATAELTIRARTAEEAEEIARDKGLPWRKAQEGDSDHHYIDVQSPDEDSDGV